MEKLKLNRFKCSNGSIVRHVTVDENVWYHQADVMAIAGPQSYPGKLSVCGAGELEKIWLDENRYEWMVSQSGLIALTPQGREFVNVRKAIVELIKINPLN